MAEEPAGEAEVLRIAIQGGGCSGFEYALGFDRGAQSGDHELEFHGVKVVVDPFSAPYLQGATIDFLEGLQESGFKIENPNATAAVRLRAQLPGRRGRARPAHDAAGCGSGCCTDPRTLARMRRAAPVRAVSRVAVVGSGPAGFYAAAPLLKSEDPRVEVDLIDRLPTPWGLVRLGVAPDHENIKAVSRAFEKTAARAGLPLLRQRRGRPRRRRTTSSPRLYDAVVYTVGAQTDRRLGIPGEDLPGSWPATAFVAWYNGHPDFQDLRVRPLARARGRDRERQRRRRLRRGCSRSRAEELAPTDTTDAAIDAIVGSGLRRDRDARPPRAGAGGVHAARAEGARRARRRRRGRRSGRPRARPGERARARGRPRAGAAQPRAAARVRRARARGQAAADRAALPRLAGRDPRRRTGSRAIEVVRNELVEEDGRIVARADRRDGDDPVRPRPAERRLQGRRRCPACRSTRQRGTIPNDRGRVGAAAERGPTRRAGSSAARAA